MLFRLIFYLLKILGIWQTINHLVSELIHEDLWQNVGYNLTERGRTHQMIVHKLKGIAYVIIIYFVHMLFDNIHIFIFCSEFFIICL